jgi:phage tail sheath protein FI/uncharacterized protein YjdB
MAAFTFPGVYIEELPSGQHTITGVATSIAAFIGWAPQGPVTQATLIQSWAEYQTIFGGLDSRSKLGYAVNQFFGNGGQQCYVVRLVWDGTIPPASGTPAPAKTASATGIGYALAEITATIGSVSETIAVGIGQPVLEALVVTAGDQPVSAASWPLPPMPLGATANLAATAVYSDASTGPAPAGTTWVSSNPAVASVVAGTGVVTAMAPGSAAITATSGLAHGSFAVTVTAIPFKGVTVSPSTISIALGLTQPLVASATYADGTAADATQVSGWTSSAATTATVTSGLVTGVAPGTATITATLPWTASGTSSSQTAAITVTAATPTSAVLYPSNAILAAGQATAQTAQFTMYGIESSGPPQTLAPTWTSSNPGVATIDPGGLATAVGVGTTTITGTLGTLTASRTLTVTVKTTTLSAISIAPAQVTLAAGLAQQLKATGVYSDGTTADLTGTVQWSSGVATVSIDPNGLLHGLAVSTAPNVTASWQGVTSGPISVTVTAAVLESIQIAPALGGSLTSILAGQSVGLNVTGMYSDGSGPTDVTSSVVWSVSPAQPTLVTVTAGAPATATAAANAGGSLSLFAQNPGAWGNNLRVTVTAPPSSPPVFNLLVQLLTASGAIQTLESFVGLSVSPSDPNYAVTVIDADSSYVTFVDPATGTDVVPSATPSSTTTPVALAGGDDGAVLVPTDGNFELALVSLTNQNAGVNLLDRVDIFNLLCVPGETDSPTINTLQQCCHRKRAFYIVDPPLRATIASLITTGPVGSSPGSITSGDEATNSALYFPWILAPDPLAGNRPALYPPCGFVAGIFAATDANIGVWKAPAGIHAALSGNSGLQFVLTDPENGSLNPQAVNCLRQFKTYGDVVWGARTLAGSDQQGSQWKYVPIRRLALYLESSLYQGTQWVVFEPNDERLWGQIRLNVGTFMQGLFLQGAFAGSTPQKAYFVKCDAENNPPASIALGVVNILVGFAPLYPAEFVVIQIQQIVAQAQA